MKGMEGRLPGVSAERGRSGLGAAPSPPPVRWSLGKADSPAPLPPSLQGAGGPASGGRMW